MLTFKEAIKHAISVDADVREYWKKSNAHETTFSYTFSIGGICYTFGWDGVDFHKCRHTPYRSIILIDRNEAHVVKERK